jgi:hypothetical protein
MSNMQHCARQVILLHLCEKVVLNLLVVVLTGCRNVCLFVGGASCPLQTMAVTTSMLLACV